MLLKTLKKFLIISLSISFVLAKDNEDETGVKKTMEDELHGVRYANMCEACKILAIELQERLTETGKTHEVIEMGYSIDGEKKKTKYTKSELRLIESTEDVCEQVLRYNIHKERKDSTRFAKGQSQTFETLHGLVNKGVKVELGIPYELWDKPSAEITELKTQCETLKERYEDVIEDWYWNRQEESRLIDFLCRDRVLNKRDAECLEEVFVKKEKKRDNKKTEDDENEEGDDDSDKEKSSKKSSNNEEL